MKDTKIRFSMAILLLLVVLVSTSCTVEVIDLEATRMASATQTASVTPTVTAPPPIEIALLSVHGQYVTALGEEDDWALGQMTDLGPCGQFIQRHFANGKIALETCYGRYVTAPASGTEESDWLLGQEPELSDCGQFELYDLGRDSVAFRTCAGRFFTPGDYTWDSGLEWKVKAQTDYVDAWEIFTVLQP